MCACVRGAEAVVLCVYVTGDNGAIFMHKSQCTYLLYISSAKIIFTPGRRGEDLVRPLIDLVFPTSNARYAHFVKKLIINPNVHNIYSFKRVYHFIYK